MLPCFLGLVWHPLAEVKLFVLPKYLGFVINFLNFRPISNREQKCMSVVFGFCPHLIWNVTQKLEVLHWCNLPFRCSVTWRLMPPEGIKGAIFCPGPLRSSKSQRIINHVAKRGLLLPRPKWPLKTSTRFNEKWLILHSIVFLNTHCGSIVKDYFLNIYFTNQCVCVCARVCVHVCRCLLRPVELELHAVVSHPYMGLGNQTWVFSKSSVGS